MTTPRSKTISLAGWGNYPRESSPVYRPERTRDLAGILAAATGPLISRGLGRSYGDAALNGAGKDGQEGSVLLHTRLNRLLAFDPDAGVLHAEAGVSLADILDAFAPRGWFLPVTPGTRFVTLGGAIAADVHGKNHHRDGTLAEFILDFRLLTATGQVLTCSRDENPDVFWATTGGMGLTGAILDARLRLVPVPTAYLNVDYQKAANIEDALSKFGAGDNDYQYSVAWIDCLATGPDLGRSVLIRGNHATPDDLPEHLRARPLTFEPHRKKSVPFNMPGFVLNPWTVKLFNNRFYNKHKDETKLVDYDTFFYPLDGVAHWNRMYGRRGFVQYQALFPHETARAGLVELLEKLSASRRASFLAVLKTMGKATPAPLSFPFPGQTLALDLPNTGPDLLAFLDTLDQTVLKHDGRIYLAKDARSSPDTIARMYPELPRFREIQSRLDPTGRFSSSLSRRLHLTGGAP